jgi:hypothetical protein
MWMNWRNCAVAAVGVLQVGVVEFVADALLL